MEATRALSHQDVDRRILRLVEACVAKIDEDAKLLDEARRQAHRYTNHHVRKEWEAMLQLPWDRLRAVLLEKSEEGNRLRQSVPFGGFLSNEERQRVVDAT
jgi:hypothetical protein